MVKNHDEETSSLVAAIKATSIASSSDHVPALLSLTFHVESFRIIGMGSLLLMLIICTAISKLFVFEGDGLLGFGWGTVDPKSTTIYKLYGFNHSCSNLDFNPSRLVAAILVPFVMVPMALYNFFFHLRVIRAYRENVVGYKFLLYSRMASIYNIIAFLMLHLWFVNTPDGDYGFLGHYIPYIMCQVALAFMAISQVHYLKATGKLPWSIPDWMADTYVAVIILLTLMSQILGLTLAAGYPIFLDPKNHPSHVVFLETLSTIYVPLIFFVPLFFAKQHLQNGDVHTITYH